jgi:hypothetical protein
MIYQGRPSVRLSASRTLHGPSMLSTFCLSQPTRAFCTFAHSSAQLPSSLDSSAASTFPRDSLGANANSSVSYSTDGETGLWKQGCLSRRRADELTSRRADEQTRRQGEPHVSKWHGANLDTAQTDLCSDGASSPTLAHPTDSLYSQAHSRHR